MASSYNRRSSSSGSDGRGRSANNGKFSDARRDTSSAGRGGAPRMSNPPRTQRAASDFAPKKTRSTSSARSSAGASFSSPDYRRPSRSSSPASFRGTGHSSNSRYDGSSRSSNYREDRNGGYSSSAYSSNGYSSNRYSSSNYSSRSVRDIQAQHSRSRRSFPWLKIIASAAVVLVLVIGSICVYNSSLFAITNIQVSGVSYRTADEIISLADVADDATLLRVDINDIRNRVQSDSWVASAKVSRSFPDGLVIEVKERNVAAVVELEVATATLEKHRWAIASDGTWLLELIDAPATPAADATPDAPATPDGTSPNAASQVTPTAQGTTPSGDNAATNTTALPTSNTTAQQSATVQTAAESIATRLAAEAATKPLINEVSATLSPKEGQVCTDAGIVNSLKIIDTLSSDLLGQIASIQASSVEATMLTLTNGVEISFGSSADALKKERILLQLLEEHAGNISYINIRVPDRPAWRGFS